jgi:hypothetical protein
VTEGSDPSVTYASLDRLRGIIGELAVPLRAEVLVADFSQLPARPLQRSAQLLRTNGVTRLDRDVAFVLEPKCVSDN